jgi:hypothetical protein
MTGILVGNVSPAQPFPPGGRRTHGFWSFRARPALAPAEPPGKVGPLQIHTGACWGQLQGSAPALSQDFGLMLIFFLNFFLFKAYKN